jgi:hypothetical protein
VQAIEPDDFRRSIEDELRLLAAQVQSRGTKNPRATA